MEKKEKKRFGPVPVLATLVAVLAVAAVIVFLVIRAGVDIGGILGAVRTEAAKEYLYENTSKISVSAVGRGFAVLTGTELRVMNEKGEETYVTFIAYSDPIMTVSGERGVAWDAGGKSLIAFTERGESFKAETENAIVSVFINAEGYVTAATEEPGYGGAVTVYNPNGRALYKWYSGANYIVSGKMRERSELLCLSMGKAGSSLNLYRINDEAEQGSFTYDGVILDAGFNQNGVTVLTDTKLIMLNRGLTQRGEYSFDGSHLDGCILGESCTLLVLSSYAVGGGRDIVLVDTDGVQSARITVSGLETFAMNEKTVAVKQGGRIDLYNARLELQASIENAGSGDRLCLRDENTVILCGDYSAKVLTAAKGE